MKQFLTTLLMAGALSPVMAGIGHQKTGGLYLSMNDYLADHRYYAYSNMKLHTRKPYLSIRADNGKMQVPRDSIFAVTLRDGKTYRLLGHTSYEILNRNARLLLYKRKIMTAVKTFPRDNFQYYFSVGDGPLQELTGWNLKNAFSGRKALPDQLDVNFRQDSDLMSYDSFHHMYKLEWLLQ
ncbi:MAG: hypothetical protein J7623_28770 [Chitinophaga sp.]|uniref:hypothetical protein n=1 Tax=Chitinophaga sp. TaxID=1869181 RepID=UPI001B239641|nr:hypothetical protein [Chitinophaga sp.]MBO9732671.1 hypothetical protein [Chitinophaga sp.]